jgi:hypothetical protein
MSNSPIREAYEIGFDSELPLPELPVSLKPADITVRFGEVPENLPDSRGSGPIFQARPGDLLLDALVGRFMVSDGNRVVIERKGSASDHDLRIVLLRPVMGAIFHQRGLLALHASAVATPQGAVVFCGHSGYGKSTLAGAFKRRGYDVLADDQSVISISDSSIEIRPTYPSLYLLPDSMDALEHRRESGMKIRKNVEKYQVPVADRFCAQRMPLHRLYLLHPSGSEELKLGTVPRREAFRELLGMIYRLQFAGPLGCEADCFSQLSRLVARVGLTRVSRPLAPFQLESMVDLLEKDFC